MQKKKLSLNSKDDVTIRAASSKLQPIAADLKRLHKISIRSFGLSTNPNLKVSFNLPSKLIECAIFEFRKDVYELRKEDIVSTFDMHNCIIKEEVEHTYDNSEVTIRVLLDTKNIK